MTKKHFIISIFIAIFIHASMLFYYFSANKNSEGAKNDGENGLEVGVGIVGSFTEINKKSEDSKKSVKEEKIIEEPEEIIKEKPKKEKEDIHEEIVQKIEKNTEEKEKIKEEIKKSIEKKVVQKDENKIKKKVQDKIEKKTEKKIKKQIEKKEVEVIKEETTKKPVVSKQQTAEKSSQDTIESLKQGTGSQNQETLGGSKGAIQSYLSVIKTKIARTKKYPRSARREGVTGTATVSFTIKLNGKVKDVTLVKSSGNERLDEEALKMLKRASPFPAIPDDVSKEAMNLTIPIEFALKTVKNKFY